MASNIIHFECFYLKSDSARIIKIYTKLIGLLIGHHATNYSNNSMWRERKLLMRSQFRVWSFNEPLIDIKSETHSDNYITECTK